MVDPDQAVREIADVVAALETNTLTHAAAINLVLLARRLKDDNETLAARLTDIDAGTVQLSHLRDGTWGLAVWQRFEVRADGVAAILAETFDPADGDLDVEAVTGAVRQALYHHGCVAGQEWAASVSPLDPGVVAQWIAGQVSALYPQLDDASLTEFRQSTIVAPNPQPETGPDIGPLNWQAGADRLELMYSVTASAWTLSIAEPGGDSRVIAVSDITDPTAEAEAQDWGIDQIIEHRDGDWNAEPADHPGLAPQEFFWRDRGERPNPAPGRLSFSDEPPF